MAILKSKGLGLHIVNENIDEYKFFEIGDNIPEGLVEQAKELGAVFDEVIKKKPKVNLDLNNDGVVDGKDASIAGKVLKKFNKKKGKR